MMDIKVNEDYEQIDAENIKEFSNTGLNNPEEYRYRCVICGMRACIEDSMSVRGHRLIHTCCMRKAFGCDTTKAFKWMREKEDGE